MMKVYSGRGTRATFMTFFYFILFYFFFLNDGVPSPIGPIRLIYPKAPRTRIQSKFSATEVPMRLAC